MHSKGDTRLGNNDSNGSGIILRHWAISWTPKGGTFRDPLRLANVRVLAPRALASINGRRSYYTWDQTGFMATVEIRNPGSRELSFPCFTSSINGSAGQATGPDATAAGPSVAGSNRSVGWRFMVLRPGFSHLPTAFISLLTSSQPARTVRFYATATAAFKLNTFFFLLPCFLFISSAGRADGRHRYRRRQWLIGIGIEDP
ncbi:hypothetical protein B0J18DRAFT_416337 [Chaetomium sp. MPI-SDFR-AT-0129]|nr:hypothetical protein B0J18DRAFT_416337 [Chaetomium sp. MPI-SDFR-AT-0129]